MNNIETTTETNWQTYFDAAKRNDLLAAFDAMAALGMRPLPVGECENTGTLKKPACGRGWGNAELKHRRERLEKMIQQGVPVGIGCQPDGYLVLDIDPPMKDRSKLPQAWKEAATLLFGAEDWPDTLVVKTAGGCHVWFRIVDSAIPAIWKTGGKKELRLPCGGKVEFFTGNQSQIQVACAPSAGKAVSHERIPADLPKSVESIVIDLIFPQPEKPQPVKKQSGPATGDDEAWFEDKLLKLTGNVVNAAINTRHDTYRAACRTMAGYAAGMNLESKYEHVYTQLATAHKDAKPEVSDYVLVETFKWAWKKGFAEPLSRPVYRSEEDEVQEFPDDWEEAANVATIRALMKRREWLWGDSATNVGWFITRGLHLVEGKEGTGKTRWILDLVRRWSYNLPWPDGSPCELDQHSKVLFVASDSHWDQIAMTSEAFGIPDENVIFTGPESAPYDFTSIDDPKTLAHIRHWCSRYKVAMVVIDTLMAASTRPLVDPQEVAQIAGPLRQIARELDVAIVLVGHLNAQGETWGRAMGRACDNVIRMEADERDEKQIQIKSVKARWNRFVLPTIHGTQGECGWEYASIGSAGNDTSLKTAGERTAAAVVAYLRQYGTTQPTLKTLVEAAVEKGHAEKTAYRVIKEMTADGVIKRDEKQTFTGKTIEFYSIPEEF
jgi:hypothetical protein